MLENSFTCSYSVSIMSMEGPNHSLNFASMHAWVVVLFYNNFVGFSAFFMKVVLGLESNKLLACLEIFSYDVTKKIPKKVFGHKS